MMSSANHKDSRNETAGSSCKSKEVSHHPRSKVTFGDIVEEKMRREKKDRKEPKLKTVTRKIQRLLFKPFDYDANLS